jgi:hypothetical protein
MPRLPDAYSDRDFALNEATLFLEGGLRGLSHALVFGDQTELHEAAEHMIRMTERARRFLALAAVAA